MGVFGGYCTRDVAYGTWVWEGLQGEVGQSQTPQCLAPVFSHCPGALPAAHVAAVMWRQIQVPEAFELGIKVRKVI